jgi:hypothetical protein
MHGIKRAAMRRRSETTILLKPAAVLAAGILTVSCGGMSPQATLTSLAAGDPTQGYIGMSKSEILSCAGSPYSRYESGGNETLVYRYTGAGPVPGAAQPEEKKKSSIFGSKNKKKESNDDWTCSASLVFEGGRLARVNFAHKDVRSPYEWQGEDDPEKREELRNQDVPTCNFSLPRCRR